MKRKHDLLMILLIALSIALSSCQKTGEDKNSSNQSKHDNRFVSSAPTDRVPDESGIESLISGMEEQSAPTAMTPNYTDISKLNSKKYGWGQGTQVDEQNRPISCIEFQEKYGKYKAVFIKENNKSVYLTFDEGYENGYTAKILDVLKEKKTPAVFFVTYDYAKRNPDLIRRMITEGHVVGNHSYHHPSMPEITLEKACEEITKLHDYMKDNFNYNMTLFRPPKGEYSEQTLALTQELGYQSVFWSFAYPDWDPDKQPDPAKALEKTVNASHGGAVYLLHAVSETNTNILGDFIDGVRAKGFEFKLLQ